MGKFVASPFIVLCSFLVTYYFLIGPGLVAADKYIDNMKSRPDNRDSGSGSGSVNGGGNARGMGMNGGTFGGSSSRNMRGFYGFGPKMVQISRSKIPIELDLLVDNEDGEKTKRFDDYGHLRFGKRGGEDQFDDYGHMRFGRSSSF